MSGRSRSPLVSAVAWLESLGGIAHRSQALEAGYTAGQLRSSVERGELSRIRRYWLALPSAPRELVTAAHSSGMLACVSAARRRGWWMPPEAETDPRLHVSVLPNAATPVGDLVVHWSRPIAPVEPFSLVESAEDALQHVADCLPFESALVVWESAMRAERLSREYLVRVGWKSPAARALADEATGLADSGLETIFVSRVRRRGVSVRQQVVIAGHRVDTLIGERLVGQIDGFEHHRSAADRGRDVAHDAELAARGYTVLRFTYAQVLHDWPSVSRAIGRALAAGLHLPR